MNPRPFADLVSDSSALRLEVLAWRKSLTSERLVLARDAITARFIAAIREESISAIRAECIARPLRVALYRALPGELDIASILEPLFKEKGAELHYPRVVDAKLGRMEMVRALELPPPYWHSGPYGVSELPLDWPVADPASLDLIVVPGLVFGTKGERVGMGAGYFDRYLIRAPQAVRVALTLEEQLLPSLPQHEWDQRVDWVVTEVREVRAFRDPTFASRIVTL